MNATPAKTPSPCAAHVKGWSEAQCETTNEDKRGQDSPGPGVTHSQGDMAHYDSLFAVGRELERRGGEREGPELVCMKRKDSSL